MLVLPLDHVLAVGSAVHVDPWAEALLVGSAGFELWLRRFVVGRIPGARGGDHPLGGPLETARTTDPDLELQPGTHLLSDLLGATVHRADHTRAGRVVEVRAVQSVALTSRVGPLVVTSVVHGPRRLGGELGYREDPTMGPLVLGAGLRRWHRHDAEVTWDRVRLVDWSARTVHLSE